MSENPLHIVKIQNKILSNVNALNECLEDFGDSTTVASGIPKVSTPTVDNFLRENHKESTKMLVNNDKVNVDDRIFNESITLKKPNSKKLDVYSNQLSMLTDVFNMEIGDYENKPIGSSIKDTRKVSLIPLEYHELIPDQDEVDNCTKKEVCGNDKNFHTDAKIESERVNDRKSSVERLEYDVFNLSKLKTTESKIGDMRASKWDDHIDKESSDSSIIYNTPKVSLESLELQELTSDKNEINNCIETEISEDHSDSDNNSKIEFKCVYDINVLVEMSTLEWIRTLECYEYRLRGTLDVTHIKCLYDSDNEMIHEKNGEPNFSKVCDIFKFANIIRIQNDLLSFIKHSKSNLLSKLSELTNINLNTANKDVHVDNTRKKSMNSSIENIYIECLESLEYENLKSHQDKVHNYTEKIVCEDHNDSDTNGKFVPKCPNDNIKSSTKLLKCNLSNSLKTTNISLNSANEITSMQDDDTKNKSFDSSIKDTCKFSLDSLDYNKEITFDDDNCIKREIYRDHSDFDTDEKLEHEYVNDINSLVQRSIVELIIELRQHNDRLQDSLFGNKIKYLRENDSEIGYEDDSEQNLSKGRDILKFVNIICVQNALQTFIKRSKSNLLSKLSKLSDIALNTVNKSTSLKEDESMKKSVDSPIKDIRNVREEYEELRRVTKSTESLEYEEQTSHQNEVDDCTKKNVYQDHNSSDTDSKIISEFIDDIIVMVKCPTIELIKCLSQYLSLLMDSLDNIRVENLQDTDSETGHITFQEQPNLKKDCVSKVNDMIILNFSKISGILNAIQASVEQSKEYSKKVMDFLTNLE